MQDGRKAARSIPYVSVAAFFPSLKQNFIVYRSSKVSSRPDYIFEIHQLWQSGFSRVYSNSCCSCSFAPEVIKIGQSSHKMYSNNTLNRQESTAILNACTKKVWKLIEYTTYMLKHKEVFKKFVEWKAMVLKPSGKRVKTLRTDNGGEYNSREFENYLKRKGIRNQNTVPETSKQNGETERMNRTLVETTC